MSPIAEAPGLPRRVTPCLQPVAIGGSWLALVALVTTCFFAPRGAEAQPTPDDVIGFGGSMAIAGAAAAIVAFGIGGRWKWAVQSALCVVLVGAVAAMLLFISSGSIRRFCDNRWTSGRSSGFSISRRAGANNLPDTTGRWGPLWGSRSARPPVC